MPNSERVLQVVNEIQQRIALGRYVPGEHLPAERSLSAALGVSRGVLREALRTLGGMGLVKSRHGSGTRVEQPRIQHVSAGYQHLLTRLDHHPEYLFAIRISLEPNIAALAATHRTDEHLAALEQTQKVLARPRPSFDTCIQADLEFHSILADATGNPMFEIVLGPVQGLLLEYRRRANPHCGRKLILEQHGRILNAVKAQDPDQARNYMNEHVETAKRLINEYIELYGFNYSLSRAKPRARTKQ
jgi:GntR family transcriptional regulator, transcriptional repressor for pyruvate dehydrogenase complex